MGAILHSPEFWVAVGFVILVVAIAKPVGRAFGSMLDARSGRIKETLDEATRLREEAQHLLAEHQRKQRDAVRETEEMLARAKEEAERLAAEAVDNLEVALKRREEMAHDKIARAEAEALQQVRETAVDVAVAATRKLIADKLDQGRRDALVDEAISELPDKLH
jgi:F-type H+-transporting ATPase subunit b